MGYKPFTRAERYQLFELNLAGLTVEEMIRHLRRSRSCLYDEFLRGGGRSDYCPERAQHDRDEAVQRSAANHPTKLAAIQREVVDRLKQDWSPEQIAGRARLLGQEQYSTSGMYRMIVRNHLEGLLRRAQCRKDMPRPASRPYGGNAKPIRYRPKEVHDRIERGHWEADTAVGRRKDRSRLMLSIERQTEYVVCHKLPRVNAKRVASLLRRDLAESDLPFATITTDRGVEFSKLGDALPNQAYVCDPHQPNQRGSNENAIGLLRQYFPKGKSLDNVKSAKLRKAQDKLNHRPRKSLGYRTPHEVMFDIDPTVRS